MEHPTANKEYSISKGPVEGSYGQGSPIRLLDLALAERCAVFDKRSSVVVIDVLLEEVAPEVTIEVAPHGVDMVDVVLGIGGFD